MGSQPPNNVTGAVPLYGDRYIQHGSEDPWTGTATDESDALIRTNLTEIDTAVISVDDTYGIAIGTDADNNMYLAIERVVSSGTVKVVRTTQAASLGQQSFSYIMIGTQNTTD